jgi:hypothetical protein
LIRWSALEEIANGKPGGAEQIKRDIASTHIRAGIAAGSAAPLTIRHMAPGRTASDGRNRPKAIIRRRRPNDANRRTPDIQDRAGGRHSRGKAATCYDAKSCASARSRPARFGFGVGGRVSNAAQDTVRPLGLIRLSP